MELHRVPAAEVDDPAMQSRPRGPGWTEMAIIVGFWSFLALLMASSRLVDPHGGQLEEGAIGREVGRAFVTYFFWVVLTPFLFRFISRYSIERHNWKQRAALHLSVAVVVAMAADIFTDFVRVYLFPSELQRFFPFDPVRDIRRLWFLNELIIYFALLSAGVARDYFLRLRARQEETSRLRTQLVEARLEALRAQLNPHFLFNTLHAVSSLVEHDPRGVRRMIARLSALLRYTLEESKTQEVPLRQELGFLRDYLEIQQIRFQGRLEVIEDVDPDVLDALLPGLIIQPLVENAIKHGVSKADRGGQIEIRARRVADRLEVSILDNGPGLLESPTNGRNGRQGLGLANTRERLLALYGTDHALTLQPRADGGTLATVSVPYHTIDDLRTAGVEE
ncbi:MAG TPA: histidine kinase [Rhodothermales bacterium]